MTAPQGLNTGSPAAGLDLTSGEMADCRGEFEAWMKDKESNAADRPLMLKRKGDGYEFNPASDRWKIWVPAWIASTAWGRPALSTPVAKEALTAAAGLDGRSVQVFPGHDRISGSLDLNGAKEFVERERWVPVAYFQSMLSEIYRLRATSVPASTDAPELPPIGEPQHLCRECGRPTEVERRGDFILYQCTPCKRLWPSALPAGVGPQEERSTYQEIFLKEVERAFDERHPCFYGDCDHTRGKDCELAIKDAAREMVEEYFAPPSLVDGGALLRLAGDLARAEKQFRECPVHQKARASKIMEEAGDRIRFLINGTVPDKDVKGV